MKKINKTETAKKVKVSNDLLNVEGFRFGEKLDKATGKWVDVDANDLTKEDKYITEYRCKLCHISSSLVINQPLKSNCFRADDHVNCPCTKKIRHKTIVQNEKLIYDRNDLLSAFKDNTEENNNKGSGVTPPGGKGGKGRGKTIDGPVKVKNGGKRKLIKLKSILDREILMHENINDKDNNFSFSKELILPEKKNEIIENQPEEFEGLLILNNDEPRKIGLKTENGKIWLKDFMTKDPKNALHISISIPNNNDKNLELISILCGQKSLSLRDKDKIVFVFGRFTKKLHDEILTYDIKLDDRNICYCMPRYTEEQILEWIRLVRTLQ